MEALAFMRCVANSWVGPDSRVRPGREANKKLADKVIGAITLAPLTDESFISKKTI